MTASNARTTPRGTAKLYQQPAVKAALADVIVDQPDRQIWHRAAASLGPDEDIAVDLEAEAAGLSGMLGDAGESWHAVRLLSAPAGARLLLAARRILPAAW